MAGIIDKLYGYVTQANDAYQENIGQPFVRGLGMLQEGQQELSRNVSEAGKGYLGLGEGSSEAFRTGQALGNMPGVGAPSGAFKAATHLPEIIGLGITAGASALKAPKGVMKDAKTMFESGFDPRTIYKATGVEVKDGLPMMWEIDDSKAMWNNVTELQKQLDNLPPDGLVLKAGEAFGHKELYENYPDLQNTKIKILPDSDTKGFNGWYDIPNDTIVIRQGKGDLTRMRSTMLHEFDHAVATKELFPAGGNPQSMTVGRSAEIGKIATKQTVERLQAQLDKLKAKGEEVGTLPSRLRVEKAKLKQLDILSKYQNTPEGKRQAYMDLYGEMRARNTQTRSRMTKEERLATHPEDTMDIPTQGEPIYTSPTGSVVYDHPDALRRTPE